MTTNEMLNDLYRLRYPIASINGAICQNEAEFYEHYDKIISELTFEEIIKELPSSIKIKNRIYILDINENYISYSRNDSQIYARRYDNGKTLAAVSVWITLREDRVI